MKNSLKETGLSMTQAQSLSNLAYQTVKEITNRLEAVNSAKKSLTIDNKVYIKQKAITMPEDVYDLLQTKGTLTSLQAFLMENLKAKVDLAKKEENREFIFSEEEPKFVSDLVLKEEELVDEEWGKNQLSLKEINEFLEKEAIASVLGQFIHKGSKLDTLRKEINSLPDLEWFEIKKDEKIPVIIEPNFTSEELLEMHEKLSKLHRQNEERVNYFKAKIKNLVSDKNAEIQKQNSERIREYGDAFQKLRKEYADIHSAFVNRRQAAAAIFEAEKEKELKRIAKLRIEIDPRFQAVVDMLN